MLINFNVHESMISFSWEKSKTNKLDIEVDMTSQWNQRQRNILTKLEY